MAALEFDRGPGLPARYLTPKAAGAILASVLVLNYLILLNNIVVFHLDNPGVLKVIYDFTWDYGDGALFFFPNQIYLALVIMGASDAVSLIIAFLATMLCSLTIYKISLKSYRHFAWILIGYIGFSALATYGMLYLFVNSPM